MSDLSALLVGAGIGLLIGGTALWSLRSELRQGWRERRRELFGDAASASMLSPTSEIEADPGPRRMPFRRLAILVNLLVVGGSLYLAVTTVDATMRVVNIAVCSVSALSAGILLLDPRQQ